MKKYKKIIAIAIIIIFVAFLITLFFFLSPTQIVSKIGVQNSYILAFFVSFFGGFSAGGSATFISLLIALVLGGLNPYLLGIIAGVSLALGDMIMFYVGSKGRELVRRKWDKRIERLSNFIKKRRWLERIVPFLAYIYIGLVPLPNDILILFMAAIEYPRKKMNIIIILGDLTFALMITLLTAKGIMIFA